MCSIDLSKHAPRREHAPSGLRRSVCASRGARCTFVTLGSNAIACPRFHCSHGFVSLAEGFASFGKPFAFAATKSNELASGAIEEDQFILPRDGTPYEIKRIGKHVGVRGTHAHLPGCKANLDKAIALHVLDCATVAVADHTLTRHEMERH